MGDVVSTYCMYCTCYTVLETTCSTLKFSSCLLCTGTWYLARYPDEILGCSRAGKLGFFVESVGG
eukprot:SAG11_NODE_36516_length_261_cov_0.635802_1_plen_64_part_01